jgi:hypothetical protein
MKQIKVLSHPQNIHHVEYEGDMSVSAIAGAKTGQLRRGPEHNASYRCNDKHYARTFW